MLVLNRKTSERIHIGNDIVVTIIKTGGNLVKIGIDAPLDVRILRDEILENDINTRQPMLTVGQN